MCNPIHGIRFCTCEEVNEDGTMSYWQLHRNIAGEQIITMGMPMYGYYVSTNRAPMLRRIRKALDSGTAFDFAYTPKEGDHLSIHIAEEADGVPFESPMTNFGYEYKDGKWRYKEYDSFTWLWERVDVEMGCVGVRG
jgi:hypothetical protein